MAQNSSTSFPSFTRFDPGSILDELSDEDAVMMDGVETRQGQPDRLIVALDFGTTFSSVAYAGLPHDVQPERLELDSVFCIKNYPDQRVVAHSPPREDVPTESWYNTHCNPTMPQYAADSTMSDAGEDSNSGLDSADEFPLSDNEGSLEREQQRAGQESRLDLILWGFGVQKHLQEIDIPKDDARRLARFKLILDSKSSETDSVRAELAPILKSLKRSKVIEDDTDVITHYIEQLLRHTKNQLEFSGAYNNDTVVEFVLCVPGVWPYNARLTMQKAMTLAVKKVAFGHLVCDSLDNLFIVSEPEAAAACVIEEDEETIYPGETIVIVDAGGGTVDAVTYRVANSLPLRLTEEVVRPSTRLCGASYINERFEERLMKRLKNEKYLEKNGKTIKSIVEGKVIDFENGQKRVFDAAHDFHVEAVYIDDLRPSKSKKFHQNRLIISKLEMDRIFKRSLNGAEDMVREQLELAKAQQYSVQKVILIGGFGQSPALQSRLRKIVAAERNYLGQEIHFLTPSIPSTVVARGAVLRALNKEKGPRRVIECSYGFLYAEVYQPEEHLAHRHTKCRIDRVDGEKYIDKTISWKILKGEELPYHCEFQTTVVHTHTLNKKTLWCTEQVYVSDSRHESHYRATHAMNKGARIAGSIDVDMSFLRDENHIQPTEPSESSVHFGNKSKSYYLVEFDLVMILDGRNLRYEARWPPAEQLGKFGQTQRVQDSGQICVAAAFKPGTA